MAHCSFSPANATHMHQKAGHKRNNKATRARFALPLFVHGFFLLSFRARPSHSQKPGHLAFGCSSQNFSATSTPR